MHIKKQNNTKDTEVQIYNDVTKQTLGVLMGFGIPAAIKWISDRRGARELAKADAISIHDTITHCKNEMDRRDDYIASLEGAMKQQIKRFNDGKVIDERDMERLELELEQKPNFRDRE